MGTAQWPQEIMVKPIEELVTNICSKPAALDRKARAQQERALKCPRCNSINTKFGYYNSYCLSQPRFFCKACRRYWTLGGSLRNIPVGGGSRKNKRSSSSSSSSSSPKNPKIHGGGQDLNLTFPASQGYRSNISELVLVPNDVENNNKNSQLSALELLTGNSSSSRGLILSFPCQFQTQIPFSLPSFRYKSLNRRCISPWVGLGVVMGVSRVFKRQQLEGFRFHLKI